MSELLRGALIIDLEKNEGWKNHSLPLHIPVVPPFTIEAEKIPAASWQVSERLEQFEPFVCVANTVPGYNGVVRRLTSQTMMKLHLDALMAIREFAEPMESSHIGDWYKPRIILRSPKQQFHVPIIPIETVTLVTTRVKFNQPPVWELAHSFNLRSNTQ